MRPRRCAGSRWRVSSAISASRSIRSPSARRRVSWRMRNGVSSRWVAALAVVTSSCGLFGLRLQPLERRQPLGHHPQRGRGAVVGQAVPGRAGSAPRGRARTPARCRPARASPLRRRRSTTARPPRRPCAARARSPASHGRKPAGTPGEGQRRRRRCRMRCSGSLIGATWM